MHFYCIKNEFKLFVFVQFWLYHHYWLYYLKLIQNSTQKIISDSLVSKRNMIVFNFIRPIKIPLDSKSKGKWLVWNFPFKVTKQKSYPLLCENKSHTEKSFLNLVILNVIWILITLLQLITIKIWLNLARFRKYLSECAGRSVRGHGDLQYKALKEKKYKLCTSHEMIC